MPKVDRQPVLTSDDVLTLIEAEVKVQHPDLTDSQKRDLVNAAAIKAAARIPEPADGKDGADGPTLEDLRPIVRAEVARIPAPEDGRTPTADEVSAAIVTLCGGECRGPAGADGKDGADGRDGVDGQPGKDGADGQDGAPGRGITAITCEADGTWTFTFSDGTTSTATGPCRVPEPTPEPTPTTSEPTPTTTTGATP